MPIHLTAKHVERFWNHVAVAGIDECWLWQQSLARGYGRFFVDGRRHHVSRVSWTIAFGQIPDGLYVCHRCDNPTCVNPAHLFLGTQFDNMRDMREKGRERKTGPLGTRAAGAILNEQKVKEIRSRYGRGEVNQFQLAAEYGVTQTAISCVVTRRSWAHVMD